MSPHEELLQRLPPNACGIELGAHTLPIPGITPLYIDRVQDFVATAGHVDVLADALALPFRDGELDYVCSSHVLEHLVNPIAALFEWHRVLKPGGLLYLVVPDKRYTFDAPRAITPPEHLVSDYLAEVGEADPDHVRDFIYGSDWSQMKIPPSPNGLPGQKDEHYAMYLSRLRDGQPVDIHFHTFTPRSFLRALCLSGLVAVFRILRSAERYPQERRDGFAFLLQRRTSLEPRDRSATFRLPHPRRPDCSFALYCPTSQLPLRLEVDPATGKRLLVAESGTVYSFHDVIPNLLPAGAGRNSRPGRAVHQPASWRQYTLSYIRETIRCRPSG